MKAFLDYLCEVGHYRCFDYEYLVDDPRNWRPKKIICKQKKFNSKKSDNFGYVYILIYHPKNIGWRFKFITSMNKINFFSDFVPKGIRHLWRFL